MQKKIHSWHFSAEARGKEYRVWKYFQARLAFTMAAFNVLVQWHGFEPDPKGFVHLSIAEFGL